MDTLSSLGAYSALDTGRAAQAPPSLAAAVRAAQPDAAVQPAGPLSAAGGPGVPVPDDGVQQALAEEKAVARVMQDQLAQACRTCKERMYQDGSNDPGVSFKTPAHVDPALSASVVLGHEMEHVAHERAGAKQKGGEVVSQSVRLHGAICPECGRTYVAGGTTETVTRTPVAQSGYEAAAASPARNALLNTTA